MVAALLVAACGNNTGLGNANVPNVVDTISLYALDRTAIALPSAYVIRGNSVVRTDLVPGFDFAFNITAAGQAVLLPTGALGLGVASGVQLQSVSFDALITCGEKVAAGQDHAVDARAADSRGEGSPGEDSLRPRGV